MKDLLRIGVFGGFVTLGLCAAWGVHAWRGTAISRRLVNVFLIYTLIVSFGAGLLQKDCWPFSNWPLVASLHPPMVRYSRLVGVDANGREHDVDYRAWQPFVIEELLGWADSRLLPLEPAERDRAGAYLVSIVERGRQRAARGERVGYFDRYWGPFTAPYFLLHPKLWTSPEQTPAVPLVGVRFYHESWNLEERRVHPSAVQRSLVYEYLPR
jgi:hypothetical protein